MTNVLAGGGTQNYFALESELERSNAIFIDAKSLPSPASLEQLQENYNLFETKKLSVEIR